MAKASVRGDRETVANMKALRDSFPPHVIDAGCREALRPMADKTRSNAASLAQPGAAPKGGHLHQGVALAKRDESRRTKRIWWIAFKRRARKTAHLVEFGTAPHWQPNYMGGFMHPGARPKPFFRPAFETTKDESISRFAVFASGILRERVALLRIPR